MVVCKAEKYLLSFQIGNKAKGQISKWMFQENKTRQIFRKNKHFLPRDTQTCGYQGVRNIRFFGKFGVLCFLETLVLRFAFLPYYVSKEDNLLTGFCFFRLNNKVFYFNVFVGKVQSVPLGQIFSPCSCQGIGKC